MITPEEKSELLRRIEDRIDRFSDLMKSRMAANIEKGDWRELPPAGTALNLVSQVGDLAMDLMGKGVGGDMGRLHRCVNIANFAFILADTLVGHLFSDDNNLDCEVDEK